MPTAESIAAARAKIDSDIANREEAKRAADKNARKLHIYCWAERGISVRKANPYWKPGSSETRYNIDHEERTLFLSQFGAIPWTEWRGNEPDNWIRMQQRLANRFTGMLPAPPQGEIYYVATPGTGFCETDDSQEGIARRYDEHRATWLRNNRNLYPNGRVVADNVFWEPRE